MAAEIEEPLDKRLVQQYFCQLVHGCDSIMCDEVECKGNFGFFESDSLEETVKRANKLALDHEKSRHLCKNLSPIFIRTDIQPKISKFDKMMEFYLKNENVDVDLSAEDEKTFLDCISDCEIFPFILTFGEIPFAYTDMHLNDDTLYNLYKFNLCHSHILAKYKKEILAMYTRFLEKFVTSRFHIRGIILMFCFLVFVNPIEFETVVCRLVSHILYGIGDIPKYFFWEIVSQFPQYLERVVSMIKGFMDSYIESQNRCLSGQIFRNICSVATFFQTVFNKKMENQELYSSDTLSETLDFDMQADSYFSPVDAIIKHPVIFNTLFKKNVFMRLLSDKRDRLLERIESQDDGSNAFIVDREHITESTLTIIEMLEGRYLLPFEVTFKGEEGKDAGGLTREFFYKLAEVAFSPDYGMFRFLNSKFYWFTPKSIVEDKYFNLLGVIVGLSAVNSVPMPIRFPLLMYKKILHKTIDLDDFFEVNPEFVKSANYMRNMVKDGGDVKDIGIYFTATIEKFGNVEDVPIIEGGEDIAVTNDNLERYIREYIDWFCDRSIAREYNSFHRGLNKVIDQRLLELFTPRDLDQLVSGDPVFNWKELMEVTTYYGYEPDDDAVKMFWDVFMDCFDDDDRRALLKFTTGCDYAPIGGFKDMEFVIERSDDVKLLPVAHTCMQTLVLPDYETFGKMKNALETIIKYTEGFGFI